MLNARSGRYGRFRRIGRILQAEVRRKNNLGRWYEINEHGARAIYDIESVHSVESQILIV